MHDDFFLSESLQINPDCIHDDKTILQHKWYIYTETRYFVICV